MTSNGRLLKDTLENLDKPTRMRTPKNQWQTPGQVTPINSKYITMGGVGFDAIGITPSGYAQYMENSKDYYFPETPVYEHPLMVGGGEMIRRADGSYSRRGLWDNIRANKGSGKKPTKEMLEQERKIRSKEMSKGGSTIGESEYMYNMSTYQNGGSFGSAFAAAKKQGLNVFEWNGKKYNTQLKEEADSNNKSNNRQPMNYTKPAPTPVRKPAAVPPPTKRPVSKEDMRHVTIDKRNPFYKFFGINDDEVKNFDVPVDVYDAYQAQLAGNQGKKFGVVSKKNARAYFFDEDGNLAIQDEVGLGSDKGDAQPIFYKVKTTPSGAYTMNRPKFSAAAADRIEKGYNAKNFFHMSHQDPNKRLIPAPGDTRPVTQAMHGVPYHLMNQRMPFFGNGKRDDNNMSAGCVNCRREFLDNPYFDAWQSGNVYVTPEKQMGGQSYYADGGSTYSGGVFYQKGGEPRSIWEVASQFIPGYETYLDVKDMVQGAVKGNKAQMNQGVIGMGQPFAGKAITNGLDYVTEKVLGKQVADEIAAKREGIVNMSDRERIELFKRYGYGGYDKWVKAGKPKLVNGGMPQAQFGILLGNPMKRVQKNVEEVLPTAMQVAPMFLEDGGGIHINPANKGKFTASAQAAGMGVQEFAAHVLANSDDYSSTQVKRANFAKNASKWKHQKGGPVVGQEMEVTPEQAEYLRSQGYQFEII